MLYYTNLPPIQHTPGQYQYFNTLLQPALSCSIVNSSDRVRIFVLSQTSQESRVRRPETGLRPRNVIRSCLSLSPPLGYTWSAEECHSAIIREKFQQFGSAGSQEFSALVKSHVFIRKKGMWRTYQHLSLASQKPAQGNT